LRLFRQDIADAQQSRSCGETIGRALSRKDLAGVFVLSDGLNVNGSELVNGLVAAIGPGIPITGGLAGDGANFAETLVGATAFHKRALWSVSVSTAAPLESATAVPAAGICSDRGGK
jgi:hypothetical protein